jgi:hypothetical protein
MAKLDLKSAICQDRAYPKLFPKTSLREIKLLRKPVREYPGSRGGAIVNGGHYLLNNFFFAAASSLSLFSPTSGYSKFKGQL